MATSSKLIGTLKKGEHEWMAFRLPNQVTLYHLTTGLDDTTAIAESFGGHRRVIGVSPELNNRDCLANIAQKMGGARFQIKTEDSGNPDATLTLDRAIQISEEEGLPFIVVHVKNSHFDGEAFLYFKGYHILTTWSPSKYTEEEWRRRARHLSVSAPKERQLQKLKREVEGRHKVAAYTGWWEYEILYEYSP